MSTREATRGLPDEPEAAGGLAEGHHRQGSTHTSGISPLGRCCVGVQPHVLVERNLEAVRSERDTELKVAREWLKREAGAKGRPVAPTNSTVGENASERVLMAFAEHGQQLAVHLIFHRGFPPGGA